jgi:hypothetical protein
MAGAQENRWMRHKGGRVWGIYGGLTMAPTSFATGVVRQLLGGRKKKK